MSRASAAVIQNLAAVTLEFLVAEVAGDRLLGSALARMSVLVIGTALLAAVELITLLAAPAASSVVHSRTNQLVVADLTVTSLVLEVLDLVVEVVAAVVEVVGLDGNLVTGSATGQDATSTTLLAEWNVSDAMLPGTSVTNPHSNLPIN